MTHTRTNSAGDALLATTRPTTDDRFAALREFIAGKAGHEPYDSTIGEIRALLDAADDAATYRRALLMPHDAALWETTKERDRLAAALRNVRGHTAHNQAADRELLVGLLASIERITDAALDGMEKL